MKRLNRSQPAVREIAFGMDFLSALAPSSMADMSSWMVPALVVSQRAESDSMAAIGMDLVGSSVRSLK